MDQWIGPLYPLQSIALSIHTRGQIIQNTESLHVEQNIRFLPLKPVNKLKIKSNLPALKRAQRIQRIINLCALKHDTNKQIYTHTDN